VKGGEKNVEYKKLAKNFEGGGMWSICSFGGIFCGCPW